MPPSPRPTLAPRRGRHWRLRSKVEAETRAQLEAKAKAEKAKAVVDAEAQAESIRIIAEAEAARRAALAAAEAKGQAHGLKLKAEGIKAIVEACGGSEDAYRMLLLEHIDKLAETSATAISNIKFDKVVVWDGQGKTDKSGAIPSFIRDVTSSVPPALDVLEDLVGINLKPGVDGTKLEDTSKKPRKSTAQLSS